MTEAPGMWGIALRGSADETFGLWTSLGLEVAAPVSLSRMIDIGGRRERAKFRLTMLARVPDLPFPLFCCEHLTPELVWEPERAPHSNGAASLREVTVLIKDDQTRRRFERILGHPASTDPIPSGSIRVGECRLEFLHESDFARRFGAAATVHPAVRPPIAALTLASADIQSARSAAETAGAQVLPTARGGFVEVIPAEGIVLEWVPLSSHE
jgi:hypothetical protein